MRYGIFGCTADPFTVAHKAIIDAVLTARLVDKVIIVPTVVDWHRQEDGKKRWLSDEDRVSVIKSIMHGDKYYDHLSDNSSQVIIDTTEHNIRQMCSISDTLQNDVLAKRRFVHTLMDIVNKYKRGLDSIYTIIGEDEYAIFDKWYEYKTILELSKLIVVTGRSGTKKPKSKIEAEFVKIDNKFSDVSASKIREKYASVENGKEMYLDEIKRERYENYGFTPEKAFYDIKNHWTNFAKYNKFNKFILGMSGGKDSTIVAKLAAEIFGGKNVYGVMMPNGEQKDQSDAEAAIKEAGINSLEVNIGEAFNEMVDSLYYSGIEGKLSNDTKINLAPRLRMAALYGLAQTLSDKDGMCCVLNTDNLSERISGYYTIFGDGAGSYAPIKNLTVTEVRKLGDFLGLPHDLVYKKPGDGLQNDGDEERIGYKYEDLDNVIRHQKDCWIALGNSEDVIHKSERRFNANSFKLKMVRIPGPAFNDLPNYFRSKCYWGDDSAW